MVRQTFIEMEFTTSGTDSADYLVRREWNALGKRTKEQVTVEKNGKKDDFLTENWSMFVESIMPSALAGFYFFDGEKIAEMAVDNTSPQLKESIRAMLGITVLDVLKNDLFRVMKRIKRKNPGNRTAQGLEKLREEKEKAEEELRIIDEQIGNIFARIVTKKAEIEDAYHDLDAQMDPTKKSMTVLELVGRYLATKTGVKPSTRANYQFVLNFLKQEDFGGKKIGEVKTSDAKLFLIKMQAEGRGYSSVKTVRGVLRPAFQMAVDDDYLQKNPFGFQLAGVVVNDSVTREAITKDQMRKFLKFVRDDNNYCKYYEAFYILFHTGMRISEFCGLTIRDLDMENRIIDINKQLQRGSKMEYFIESTKTNAGTRKIPMTEEVFRCFQAILEDREAPQVEKMVDGYTGFLYLDKNGMPEVAMHWEHRFKHAVSRYNDIYREQLPTITPHVCRHTYCSNQARAGMNPKTLQYLMGHSDIGVTMNVYTHLGLEDAAAEMTRMEEVESARREQQKLSGGGESKEKLDRKMFRVV